MDSIPLEILRYILDNVGSPLSSYASVSRQWQAEVERRTFQQLSVTNADLPNLNQITASESRHRLIRNLTYKIELPPISHKRLKKLQSKSEARQNNHAFTASVLSLFQHLSAWGRQDNMEFALCINAQSPSDDHHLHGESYRHDGDRIWDVRNEHALLDFESPDISLPSLPHVCEFSYQSRRIHPNALRVLCDAMPFLRKTTWDFSAPERRFPELRKAGRFVKTYILLNSTPVTNLALFRQYRRALVSALSSLSFSHLQSFDLVWGETEPSNDNYISPSYLDEDESTDDLSCALRRISQLPTMRNISVDGILSADLFCFEPDSSSWPALEELRISMLKITPRGEWYFTGEIDPDFSTEDRAYTPTDDGESPAAFDSDDSDTSDYFPPYANQRLNGELPYYPFRNRPSSDTMSLFLIQLGKAVMHMPALRKLELTFQTNIFELIYQRNDPNTGTASWWFSADDEFDMSWIMPQDVRDALAGPDDAIQVIHCDTQGNKTRL